MADAAAKNAAGLMTPSRPITMRSARMQIKRTFKDDTQHPRIKQVYSASREEREEEIKNRSDQVALAQIRSGKHRAFRSYSSKLDKESSDVCPRCEEEEHTLEHWMLKCPGTLEAKNDIFGGEEDFGLHQLTKNPTLSLALARRTLLGAGRQ